MSKTAFIRARVDPELKNEAELVLSELGITRWLYFRGQILYKDLKLKKYYYDKEKEFLFA